MATSADMDRHEGRGGLSGTKQPKGSTTEGTSLCGGGKSVSGTGISSDTHMHTLATHRGYYSWVHVFIHIHTTSFEHVLSHSVHPFSQRLPGSQLENQIKHPIANSRAYAFRHMQFISETVKRKDKSRDRENEHERNAHESKS